MIIGGESGQKARPFQIQWPRNIVEQCKTANVPVFMKQYGSFPIIRETEWRERILQTGSARLLTPKRHKDVPVGFVRLAMGDSKGGNMEEFEEALRIRQFPGFTDR